MSDQIDEWEERWNEDQDPHSEEEEDWRKQQQDEGDYEWDEEWGDRVVATFGIDPWND